MLDARLPRAPTGRFCVEGGGAPRSEGVRAPESARWAARSGRPDRPGIPGSGCREVEKGVWVAESVRKSPSPDRGRERGDSGPIGAVLTRTSSPGSGQRHNGRCPPGRCDGIPIRSGERHDPPSGRARVGRCPDPHRHRTGNDATGFPGRPGPARTAPQPRSLVPHTAPARAGKPEGGSASGPHRLALVPSLQSKRGTADAPGRSARRRVARASLQETVHQQPSAAPPHRSGVASRANKASTPCRPAYGTGPTRCRTSPARSRRRDSRAARAGR